ncbi:MAG: GNAT family N-acetyltransferase [Halobacteriaceae archaeon]
MSGAVYLAGEAVTLRTIEDEDLPFLRDTINDPAVRYYLGDRGPVNLEQEREWFEGEAADGENLNLLVAVDGERAGTVGLHPRVPDDGSTEVGVFLAEQFWGEGYGTEAVELVVDYAFREGRAHRVAARVIDGNDASRRVFEKLGFRHEATFQEATFHDGAYTDVHWYAVLKEEWRD